MLSDKKNKILFVIGFPRSGTTWFSNLLNAHPEIIYRHEIIGRGCEIFEEALFSDLKFNNGLNKEQHATFIKKLAIANIETDRPPFFRKNILTISNKNLHKAAWLATKLLPILNSVYKFLFTPNSNKNKTFLIKETRSTINLDSIIKGVSPTFVLFLFRQPYGAIASHIKGQRMKVLAEMNRENVLQWVKWHNDRDYIQELFSSNFNFDDVGDVEILSIKWRVYNDDLLAFKTYFSNAIYCHYDQFVDSPAELTSKLFEAVGLDFVPEVERFVLASSNKSSHQNILEKDASNDYFSVYRSAGFNKEQWKEILSDSDLNVIDKHTKGTFELLIEASH